MKKLKALSPIFLVLAVQMFSPIKATAQSLDGAEWNKTSGLGYAYFRMGYDKGIERLHLVTSIKFKSANGKEVQPKASDRLFLRNQVLSFGL